MAEKAFFRIRVKETCPYPAVMVKNLGKVTKKWLLKKGNASDYSEYPNLEVQAMIKEGDVFVPAVPDNKTETVAEPNPREAESEEPPSRNFSDMSVEQLKAYLSAKGVPPGDIRGMAKADLIAFAESGTESKNA